MTTTTETSAPGQPRWPTVVGLTVVLLLATIALIRFITLGTDAEADQGTGQETLAGQILGDLPRLDTDPDFYRTAQADLAQAAIDTPNDVEILVAQAGVELFTHHFDAALGFALRAHELRPENTSALAMVVDAEIELGQYEAAQRHLDLWLGTKPDLAALSRLSYLRELRGDTQGAIEAMTQAVSAGAPGSVELAAVQSLLGDVYLSAGNLEAARTAYGQSRRTDPTSIDGVMGEAEILYVEGNTGLAIEQVAAVAQTHPDDAGVHGYLGELYLNAGRDTEAKQSFDRMYERLAVFADSGADASLEYADMLATNGDADAALPYAREAYASRPTIQSADILAWALTRAGRADEALKYVEESLSLGTQNAEMFLHAAFAFEAADDSDRAKELLEQSFALSTRVVPSLDDDVADLEERLGL